MTQEPIALYKLIVLYMLNRVDFPLTKAQVETFVLDKEYTTYLTLQQAIGELCDDHMVDAKTVGNRTQLTLTEEGRADLHFFEQNISSAIKEEINSYLKENSMALRNEVSVTGQYDRTSKGSYQAVLTAKERGEILMELKLTVPDEDSAASLCNHWQQKSQEIYAMLMKELF